MIETMIVVALVSLLAGISFPAVTAGLETLRIKSAADGIAGLMNSALARAERRQQPVEVFISMADNSVQVRGVEPGVERRLDMPTGVRIAAILPPSPVQDPAGRRFVLTPGGAVPRIGIVLVSARGQRIVSLDPITGVPSVETPPQGAVFP
jgi:type II secretory pathway pseudopilin PulG